MPFYNYYRVIRVRRRIFQSLIVLFVLGNAVHIGLSFIGANNRQRKSLSLNDVEYDPVLPYRYPEEVDIRIVVITFNRASSLEKLLESLDKLELDGDTGYLEIWIDRKDDGSGDGKPGGRINLDTLKVARTFSWSRGRTRVHVHKKNVGICGQWLDTWRPRAGTRELALLLEDDVIVSPFAYRWLKAVHRKYGFRSDVAGYTLQSEQVNQANGSGALVRPKDQVAFLYKLIGSWGFAPHPGSWLAFQDWYHRVRRQGRFRPYVARASLITKWYRMFEAKQLQETMWTMWHVYYSDKYDLFTVYNNIQAVTNSADILLSVNRMEPGLHFQRKRSDSSEKLLRVWSPDYVKFPDSLLAYDFDGSLATKHSA
ncbi:hypothetical protein LSH36_23g04015 [Paralvinella palmiformis]|uniref:Uncharacterized protein n=1 Tax=Paralvinella palmiformis TaxID=53620 RepID=A0AAD9KAK5_9ANNE|nr:hypothetical protein LSH36_23g04015 [Paralvinella palmiformis]